MSPEDSELTTHPNQEVLSGFRISLEGRAVCVRVWLPYLLTSAPWCAFNELTGFPF